MSLFGALQSGISGLAAQSTSMGAISDNISNVNTIGYKNNSVAFSTLVTKQTSSSHYSPGGVQPVSKQGVSTQGLLASSASSTALGISGNGFFVVNSSANPGENDMWSYTRAGDFGIDSNGYLQNSTGHYAQSWPLLPWDGNAMATIVDVNGQKFMKAYYDDAGKTVYVNDNIVDPSNLRPVNLSTIGGSANPTHNLQLGANLPASDPVFDPSVPTSGGRHSVSALIYDSLGTPANLNMTYTKTAANSWEMSTSIPPGAASIVLTGDGEVSGDGTPDVTYAAGQLEFKSIPENGSSVTITDAGTGEDYTFIFTNDPTSVTAPDIAVDITQGIVSTSDFVKAFATSIQANMPSADRFSADGSRLVIEQSTAGSALTIDASKTLSCVQSAANPAEDTGIPTGIFTIPQIDNDIKNVARIDFNDTTVAAYEGKKMVVDGKTYVFTDGTTAVTAPDIAVDMTGAITGTDVDTVKLVDILASVLKTNADEPQRFIASGSSLEIIPSSTGGDITLDTTDLGTAIDGVVRDKTTGWKSVQGVSTLGSTFMVNNTKEEQGSIIPSVRFNSDGTPKYFFVNEMSIEWANGAENMNGDENQGTTIGLEMGSPGTNDGLTSLSGNFTTNYVKQDGAKFGNYAGVSVSPDGVVTALYDNGETRPIAVLPVATFSNANGMGALTGNTWIETDQSGQPLLKMGGTNGAGAIASNALEQSTVDLATEFSNMIITQRAYSASTKIITTASEMLDELTRMT